MADKKKIVVFGATGSQGGGLVHAILDDPESEFSVRAVTRDPSSESAQKLSDLGAEVVKADINNYEDIKKALDGAYGAYFVTFFWEHFSPEKEYKQAEDFAKAASKVGLKHAIWSTLEDTRKWVPLDDGRMPTLQDKYKVPHFDAKGEADKFFNENNVPTTFFYASFYWENMIHFGQGPQRGDDGKLRLSLPIGDKKMAGIAAEDIGKCAYGIFKRGDELVGEKIGAAGDQLTGDEMAEALTEALGEKVIFNEMDPEDYRKLGFQGADDMGNMYQFYRDFDDVCNARRDVEFSKQLYPDLKSFDEWLDEYGSKIPID